MASFRQAVEKAGLAAGREMLVSLGRKGRLPELVALARHERPHVAWPEVPADFQLPAKAESSGAAGAIVNYNYCGDVTSVPLSQSVVGWPLPGIIVVGLIYGKWITWKRHN